MQKEHMVSILAIFLLNSCKPPNWQKLHHKTQLNQQISAQLVPRKIDSDTSTIQPFDLDEKTGRPKVKLILTLDQIPNHPNGIGVIPSCLKPLEPNFELGSINCDSRHDIANPLLAKNVDQECYTSPQSIQIVATEILSIPGCKKATLALHKFEPNIRVDLELRDSQIPPTRGNAM